MSEYAPIIRTVEPHDPNSTILITAAAPGATPVMKIAALLLGMQHRAGWDQPAAFYGFVAADNLPRWAQRFLSTDPDLLYVGFRFDPKPTTIPLTGQTIYHSLAGLQLPTFAGVGVVNEVYVFGPHNTRVDGRQAIVDVGDEQCTAMYLRGDPPGQYSYEPSTGAAAGFVHTALTGPMPRVLTLDHALDWLDASMDTFYPSDRLLSDPGLHPDEVVDQAVGQLNAALDRIDEQVLPTHLSGMIPSIAKASTDITITDQLLEWVGGPVGLHAAAGYMNRTAKIDALLTAGLRRAELANPTSRAAVRLLDTVHKLGVALTPHLIDEQAVTWVETFADAGATAIATGSAPGTSAELSMFWAVRMRMKDLGMFTSLLPEAGNSETVETVLRTVRTDLGGDAKRQSRAVVAAWREFINETTVTKCPDVSSWPLPAQRLAAVVDRAPL